MTLDDLGGDVLAACLLVLPMKRITMRTSLKLMTMFSTIRMVNAEGKSDLTKIVCLDLMTCNRTHSSLVLRWVRTPYNVTDNRLLGCLIEPS